MNRIRHTQAGFSMIELLIAVLIVSVGLLGIAGLQAYGLRANHSSYLRSQATVLAYDALDRMRANKEVATAGTYNLSFGATPPSGSTVAATDLQQWTTNLKNTLPSGEGSIQVDSQGFATVQIRWLDDRAQQSKQTFEVDSQL